MSLRERKNELTRGTILQALVDVLKERGVHDFSVQRVADAAGVSHRTVYRHFPTRVALLEGLNSFLQKDFREKLGADTPDGLHDLQPEEMGKLSATSWGVFAANADVVESLIALAFSVKGLPLRKRHTAWYDRWTAPITAHLSSDDALAVAAILRVLGSSTSWAHARRNHQASQGALERAVRWAVETLVADLRNGGGPQKAEE